MESSQVVQSAAIFGNLEVIRWLHEAHDENFTFPNMINLAVRHGHIHVLEHIFRHRREQRSLNWLMYAASHEGRIDVLEWVHAKATELSSTMDSPSEGLERWRVLPNGTVLVPMIGAARNGNLEAVKWLDANGYGESSAIVMDWAASGGHLDVVKWLHENRTEGCTTKAMDKAAENGHFEAVKWLHENRNEGCTADAVDLAVRKGHARVVEFLLKNRTEGCTRAAVRDAIEVRHDAELIHLLFQYRRDLVEVESVRVHAEGNEATLRWLRQVL